MDNLRQSQSLVRRMGEICYRVRFWHLDKRQQGELLTEQRRRIANIDETEISLDGSTTLAGGRPSVHFSNPNLPLASKPASRSSIKCTGIFGGNAAHECIPPHFQLPTEAKAAEREKVRADFQTFLKKTNGRFDYDEVRK